MYLVKFRQNEYLITLFVLVLTNLILKLLYLDFHSLGGDEPFTVYHAQMSTSSIIRLLSEGNNPPLFEILLHYWVKLAGISPFAVRLPSLLFSCITVGFIYKFGAHFLNKRVGIYAGIIYIFSNYHVVLASEARVYALLGMLAIISMYVFMLLINKIESAENNRSLKTNIGVLLITNTLLIYAHYFGFFILATQFLFVFTNTWLRKKTWRSALIMGFAIALLYLPNIMVVLNRAIDSSTNGTWIKSPDGLDSLYNMIRQFTNAPIIAFSVVAICLIALLIWFKNRHKFQTKTGYKLVIFWFCFIFFTMFSISFYVPMFMDRYLMPAAIAFTLLVGIAVDYIVHHPTFKFIIPVGICILFIATFNPKSTIANKLNVEATIAKLKELKTANTIVYFCPNWFELNFAYYYNRSFFMDYNDTDIKANIYTYLAAEHIFPIADSSEIHLQNHPLFDQIIYLDAAADLAFNQNGILHKLKNNYLLNAQYSYPEIFNLYVFKHLERESN